MSSIASPESISALAGESPIKSIEFPQEMLKKGDEALQEQIRRTELLDKAVQEVAPVLENLGINPADYYVTSTENLHGQGGGSSSYTLEFTKNDEAQKRVSVRSVPWVSDNGGWQVTLADLTSRDKIAGTVTKDGLVFDTFISLRGDPSSGYLERLSASVSSTGKLRYLHIEQSAEPYETTLDRQTTAAQERPVPELVALAARAMVDKSVFAKDSPAAALVGELCEKGRVDDARLLTRTLFEALS